MIVLLVGGEDYVLLINKIAIIDGFVIHVPCHIDILDDFECEEDEQFFITLTLDSGSGNCEIIPDPLEIPVTITDDGRALDRQSHCMVGLAL